MDVQKYKSQTTESVVRPMIEFIEGWDEGEYTKEDVQKCENLLHHYLDNLGAMANPTDDAIMEQVKAVVLELNELNEATDYSLIETDTREAIWEIIQTSAVDCGLQNASEDITEEWRDW